MTSQPRLIRRTSAVLCALCALLFATAEALARDYGHYTEEFHQIYPLAAGGRVELDNINGDVHITGWDQNQVKVDAVKYANSKERLDAAKIVIETGSGYVSIRTRYPHDDLFWNHGGDNPASVEYTLMVPRSARLDEIKLVNGELDIHGINGEVRASSVNGRTTADGLEGPVRLSAVNGRTEVHIERLADSPIELSSVNGSIELTIPSDARAEIEASTISGGIDDDFGLHVRNHRYVGHDLRGELGGGGTRIRLSNVNGHIEIRHANDGKPLSSVRNLNGDHDEDRDDDDEM
jgi:hypothetical protein